MTIATVLAYDRATAENVVDVGGMVIANLPIVDGIGRLVTGDSVALLVAENGAAFIIGRIRTMS